MSEAAYKAMREAHALCPTELPHLDRMRWMADYVERAIIAQARAEMRAEMQPAAWRVGLEVFGSHAEAVANVRNPDLQPVPLAIIPTKD
ncbi:hypothetical protein ACL598_17745 [Bordetella bronchialis]|uniref:hypothetical protein n=1 Tax=Bordetella bronchialis TaxID=463025 RepID=UPI003D074992